jgi:ATP-binding cassette, subfamily A (ABC1), member 3
MYSDSVFEACIDKAATSNYTTANHCSKFDGVGYLVAYNFTAFHISPTLQAVATEALARHALNTNDFTVDATIGPLPLTSREAGIAESEDAFTAWFLVVLGFPFIAGAFATFVVQERESKAKHLQTVAGVEPWAYWVSTYLWDVLNYFIPMLLTIVFMFSFDVGVLTTTDRGIVGGIIVTLLLYGPASASFTYCLTFGFSSASLCNVVVIISGFLFGMGGPLTVFILEIIGNDLEDPNPKLLKVADILSWILRLHPSFCLGRSIFYGINIEILDFFYEGIDTVWVGKGMLYDVIFLAWESVIYLAIAVHLDKLSSNPSAVARGAAFLRLFTFVCERGNESDSDTTNVLAEDSDVVEEQNRILNGEANSDLIVISELTKVYSNGKKAVNNLSFGIPHGTSSSFFSCGLFYF